MKEGFRSGNPPGRVEKERGPFGCLIVKNKEGGTGSGGALMKEKGFESKVKKRPRLILNDSESSEDLLISCGRKLNACDANVPLLVKNKISRSFKREEIEFDRKSILNDSESSEDLLISRGRKLNACDCNVPLVVRNKISCSFKREEIEVDRKRMRSEHVKCGDGTSIDRIRFVESEIKRKRSRMHTFNYPDDDEFEEKMLKKEHLGDKGVSMGRSSVWGSSAMFASGNHRELETECSRSVKFHKREHFKFDRDSIFPVEQNHRHGLKDKQKFDVRKDGSFRSVGPLREKFGSSCGQPIRVQGKNGVLKVMLTNKSKVGASEKNYIHKGAVDHKASRFTDTANWEAPHSPTNSENNFHEKSHSVGMVEKNQVNSQDLSGNSESHDNIAEISDQSLLMESRSVATWGSKKEMKNKGKSSLSSEPNLSTRRKEGEVKRGSSTEKQLLREQIRHLLIDAGWTIDFRPRKNRNYQDAVYINPSGTEYWSIIKAYDALKKQYEDDLTDYKNRISSSFTPIPEVVLSQLTRQTSKKIEREKTMKQKADRGHKKAKTSHKKFQKELVKVRMGRTVNGKETDSFTMKDDKSLKFRIKGNTSIMKKSINLANDAGFREGECLLQVPDVSSGNLGKEMLRLSDANSLQGGKYKKQTGRALLVRSSNKGANSDDDDFVPYTGKRTVLSWLIDMGAVPMSGKVQYMNKRRTRTMLEGWITKDGIHCGCCSKILTVSKFEIHAGSKLRQPFQCIFLENGVSLLQCNIDAWNRQLKPERSGFCLIDCDHDDPNDDTCAICGDGGKLICCDGCPSTFHQSCVDIQMLPVGDWHCPNCSCKFCRGIGGTTGQGEDMTSSLRTCSLCEEKYHQLCCRDMDDIPLDPPSSCMSFCGQSCKEIFQKLQKFLGVKQELDAGFSWTLVQRSNLDHDTFNCGLPQKAECNSKLAVALSVIDECFLPIIDRRSGINLINSVVYNCGSNFTRLNFSGFYTFVLERGDEIISAASIRIHGRKLAEMPFIGTRHIYRRQGMCRRLLNAIESALGSLNVEKLVIPAISDLMHTWTMVFNFKPLEESHKQEMRSMNMLVFPATGLLQKPLLTNDLARGSVSDCSVVRATSKSDIGSSDEPDIHGSGEGVIHHAREINNKVAFTETSPHDPGVSACDNISYVISSHEHISLAPGKESARDRNFLPHFSVTCDDEFTLERRNMPKFPSEFKLLSSAKDVVNDANGVNIEVAGVNPDLHSSKSSLQQMTITNRKYSDAACGCSVQSTNGSFLLFNSDLDQNKVQEVEINSVEVCHFASDVSVCEENASCASVEMIEQDCCGLKSEVFAVLPDKSICDKDCVDCSLGDIAQFKDAAPVNSSQSSGRDAMHHDSEGARQPQKKLDCNREDSGKTLMCRHDSCMLQNIQESAFVDTHAEPESHRAEGEVAASGYNLQIIEKDPVESTSKMEEAGNHNIHNVADNSGAAFTDGSTFHVSNQESMLDACDAEVGVAFVDPGHHMYGQAFLSNALDSAAEPSFQGSHVNNGICNPEQLQKIPDLTSDLAHSVPSLENNYRIICCVEPNHQASVGCNVQNMHNQQEEVSGIEPGAISLGQDSINDASKVNKSMDTSESIFSTCSCECLV